MGCSCAAVWGLALKSALKQVEFEAGHEFPSWLLKPR